MDTTQRAYQVLGTDDTVTICGLCGRSDLKATVALRDLVDGQVVNFGSDCAARAAGWTVADVDRQARDADRAAADEQERQRVLAVNAATARWEQWLAATTGCTDTLAATAALGGFAAARAAYRAAQ